MKIKWSKMLSVLLAMAVLTSLLSFGAGAANQLADFPDADKVTFKEAVEVMVGAEIISGTGAGELDPKGTVTREAVAKMICYMLVGKTIADALTAETDPFTDVAASRWSAGYIDYCVDQGIISGRGNGIFDPEAMVTGNELCKMLLCAVGYGVNGEYEGGSWAMSTAKDGLSVGIFTGNTGGASLTAATREEAMLYCFNAFTRVQPVNYSSVLGAYYDTETLLGDEKMDLLSETYGVEKVSARTEDGRDGHKWTLNGTDISGVYPDAAK